MQSIRIPTDNDLKPYPHIFFTSPDTWDDSVLDHGIAPSLLEEINQDSDDSLLQDSIFDEFGELHHRVIQQLIYIMGCKIYRIWGAYTSHLSHSKHLQSDIQIWRDYSPS